MIYKFRSKASGDLIMLGPHGDQVLRLLGREPAPKGIIEPADLPAALAALQGAIAAEAEPAARNGSNDSSDSNEADAPRAVALRQRVWPMVEMLRRAQDAGVAVVWGI